MQWALLREKPDHLLHLGDYVSDPKRLELTIPLTQVPGNCDFRSNLPAILTPTFQGVKLYMTHGHLHQVKSTYLRAVYAAQEAGARILLFGHTHRPVCFQEQGLWVMNPGACGGTYGVISLSGDSVTCCVKSIQ